MRKHNERNAQPQHETVGFIEFDGKYDIVMPAELASLPTAELVRLIMERRKMDESRARKVLKRIRRGSFRGPVYDRV